MTRLRPAPIAALTFALGCGETVGAEAPADASSFDAYETSSDVTLAEPAPDAGVDTAPIATGSSCMPASGPERFGANVSGAVTFDDDAGTTPSEVGAVLLLPKGRMVGAPVSLTMRFSYGEAFSTASGVLDASLGAKLHVIDPCGNVIDAELVGPNDGLVAKVALNFGPPTDVLNLHRGHAKLCATSTIVATESSDTTWFGTPFAISRTTIKPSLPIDPTTVGTTKALAGGSPVAINAIVRDGNLVIAPVTAYPASAKSLDLDLSGVRDIFGRSLKPVASGTIFVPKTSVVSRTFDELPPPDAIVSTISYGLVATKIDSGALWIGALGRGYQMLLGLGSEPGAKTIRMRHRFACTKDMTAPKSIVVVASDGAITSLKLGCSDTFVDDILPLPGAQPTFLYIESGEPPPRPCSLPWGWGSSVGSYVIDELAFAT